MGRTRKTGRMGAYSGDRPDSLENFERAEWGREEEERPEKEDSGQWLTGAHWKEKGEI